MLYVPNFQRFRINYPKPFGDYQKYSKLHSEFIGSSQAVFAQFSGVPKVQVCMYFKIVE